MIKTSIEVSIIVPCYNEENTIQKLLSAIYRQDFPIKAIEVIIADAFSEDQTRQKILDFSKKYPTLKIKLIDNKARTIPTAVNRAAEASSGTFLIRMDAHSIPDKDYVANCVNLLKEGKAENIGGVWEIHPGGDTCMAKAIARAAAHPLGAGDAGYRISKKADFVDTVPFGAFTRETFFNNGMLNECMLANEDYEFNTRLRLKGGKIWMDPRIRSIYFARKNLKDLARQYWRYGYWKNQMLKKFPNSIKLRQAIPPLFIAGLLLLLISSVFQPIALIILLSILATYLSLLFVSSCVEAVRQNDFCMLKMVFVFIMMHFSWGGGFIYGIINNSDRK